MMHPIVNILFEAVAAFSIGFTVTTIWESRRRIWRALVGHDRQPPRTPL